MSDQKIIIWQGKEMTMSMFCTEHCPRATDSECWADCYLKEFDELDDSDYPDNDDI